MIHRSTRRLVLAALPLMGPLTGCQNLNRSLIFSTGTTIGLELSTSPASDSPVQFVFGLKRAEVLIDPVLSGKDSDTVEPRAHSVVAKLAGQFDSPTGGISGGGSQWFASGRAAELLAGQPVTAAALTDHPMIASDIAKAAQRTFGPLPDDGAATIQTQLLLAYLELPTDNTAALARFDAAARSAGFENFATFIIGNPTLSQAEAVRLYLQDSK